MFTCDRFQYGKSGPHSCAFGKYEHASRAHEPVNQIHPMSFQHTTGVRACGNLYPWHVIYWKAVEKLWTKSAMSAETAHSIDITLMQLYDFYQRFIIMVAGVVDKQSSGTIIKSYIHTSMYTCIYIYVFIRFLRCLGCSSTKFQCWMIYSKSVLTFQAYQD